MSRTYAIASYTGLCTFINREAVKKPHQWRQWLALGDRTQRVNPWKMPPKSKPQRGDRIMSKRIYYEFICRHVVTPDHGVSTPRVPSLRSVTRGLPLSPLAWLIYRFAVK